MKLWDYSVLAGKFRKVPAICRNNAGSVAHFLQQQCYVLQQQLHCRCEKNISRVSVALV